MSRNFGIPSSRYEFETRIRRPHMSPAMMRLVTVLAWAAACSAAFAILWGAAS